MVNSSFDTLQMSLDRETLAGYVSRQCDLHFPDGQPTASEIGRILPEALHRMNRLVSAVSLKYYRLDGKPFFHHLNTDQYAEFLYLMANTAYRMEAKGGVADKLYALNKALHALDVFYAVELPEIFLFSHPVGTVLGRAEYGNYFVCLQNCTIGGNVKLEYPRLGEGVALYCGASVIGKCSIGDDVQVAAGSLIMDRDVESGHTVWGRYPDNGAKRTGSRIKSRYFVEG